METKMFYNEVLTDHNMFPQNKKQIEGANMILEGVNPSCGDNIILQLRVEDDQIIDAGFVGNGCAVSQASADIMTNMVIGKTKEEALYLVSLFYKMIQDQASTEEIEQLEEAGALQDIAHMPARVKCALLGWRTLKQMFTS